MSESFAVFILSHGRPDKVMTYDSLIRQGYTGPVYIVIDNEDRTAPRYQELFGDKVVVFDKADIARRYDTGDNFPERRSVFFARNACFEIANSLGIEYFLQLDDDYRGFYYKFTSSLKYAERAVKGSLDELFEAMLKYYKSIKATVIAFGQNGDFLGGQDSYTTNRIWLKRKAMNTFFCSTHRPFRFVGRVNEDVNTYASLGNRGELIFSVLSVAIIQKTTQASGGGMTELYQNEGTYRKSFYTVMHGPSFVKIYMMGISRKRLHHRIKWEFAVPCIVNEKHKKREGQNI